MGPVEWLEATLTTAEDDARYTEAGSVFFDVSDDAVADHYQGAGSPAAVLRQVAGARAVLAEHASDGDVRWPECVRCADTGLEVDGGDYGTFVARSSLEWPCRTVRLLAEAWGWEATT